MKNIKVSISTSEGQTLILGVEQDAAITLIDVSVKLTVCSHGFSGSWVSPLGGLSAGEQVTRATLLSIWANWVSDSDSGFLTVDGGVSESDPAALG